MSEFSSDFKNPNYSNPPGFNENSKVSITVEDIVDSIDPSKKVLKWAYHKKVSPNNTDYYFGISGPSSDLQFDVAILSGARAAQVKKLTEPISEELQS